MAALTVAFLGCASSRAQEALITYKTLSPEIALDLANAAPPTVGSVDFR